MKKKTNNPTKTKEKRKITIGINASFARKPMTGMGQVTINFLRKLVDASKQKDHYPGVEMEYILYLEEDLPKDIRLPAGFSKNIFLPSLWNRDDLIRKIWWEKYALPKKVKKDHCDVLLSLYQSPTVVDIPHVMLVHDIIPSLFPEYLNNSRKRIYYRTIEQAIRQAGKLIAVSRRTEKDLVQYLNIDSKKIAVSYIDVDEIFKKKIAPETVQKVLKRYRLSPGYILAGGGLEMRKNITGVIMAYKYIHDKIKLTHTLPPLVIYGKLMPQLAPIVIDAQKLVRELNLTAQVKFLGVVPQKDMPAIFQNAQLFVYPSFYEGFGMPPLEAMSVGTPVIISKTSSLPEVGLDSALYCNPDDTHDIAMVMKNVLQDQVLRGVLSRRGKERAKNFSWDKFTKKILNIIQCEARK